MSDLAVELGSVEKVIHHEGSKWILYSHDGSKKLGEFDTEEAAKERERQINYFKHVAKSDLEMEFGKLNTCHDYAGRFCSGGASAGASQAARIKAIRATAAADPRVAEAESYAASLGDARNLPGVLDKNRKYTPEAHAENERIAMSFLNPAAIAKEGEAPVAMFLLGKPGAGKTTLIRSMNIQTPTVTIGGDDIKEKLPGYNGRNAASHHERSCDIARNYLTPIAVEQRANLIFDMTDNAERLVKTAQELKAKGYKISVVQAHVDDATSAERVYSRFLSSGRYLPIEAALSYGARPEKAYRAIKAAGLADQWRKYDTSGQTIGRSGLLDSGGREVLKRGRDGSLGAGIGRGSEDDGSTVVEKDVGEIGIGQDNDLAQEFGKFNPNHDTLGRFSSGGTGGARVEVPSRENQNKAIEDIKQELQMVSNLTGGRGKEAFVLEHGQPFYMNDKTFAGPRSPQKECYKNATQKMWADDKLTYVEGFVHIGPLAIHHAWTADKQGNVVDPTLKPGTGNVSARGYFGVPFKRDYVDATARKTKVYGIISHTNRDLFEGGAEGAVGFGKSNTCHTPSGSKGGQFCATGGGGVTVEFHPSAKMLRAIQSRVPCGVEKQRIADQQEKTIARALGLPRTGDNSAFDLRNNKVGVELKTMQDSKNGKVTMSSFALARKIKEARKEKLHTYTIVADKRQGQTQYYVRKDLGSFRVNSMTPVTISELRGFIK